MGLLDKDSKSTVLNMPKEPKETVYKEPKEMKRTLFQQRVTIKGQKLQKGTKYNFWS